MKASEYLKFISKSIEKYGDLDVCITQSGYYSDSPFACLQIPEAKSIVISQEDDEEEVSVIKIVLGHSYQHP